MKVVNCFLFSGSEFLIVKRLQECNIYAWDLPAGKVDSGEDDISALERIVCKEVGLQLQPTDLNKSKNYSFVSQRGNKYKLVNYCLNIADRTEINPSMEAEWTNRASCLKKDNLIKNLATLVKEVNPK